MTQFKYLWNEPKKEFQVTWAPQDAGLKAKRPNIPDWTVNYVNPTDVLGFKYQLLQIEQYGGSADMIFGQYGAILGIVVSRITDSIRYRYESHENQLMAIVEAAMRGQYTINMPLENQAAFLEITDLILYLNKVTDGNDVTNAQAKRKSVLAAEAAASAQNMAWFQKKGYTVQAWKDGRNATIFKHEKRKGIASLAIERHKLTKTPSFLMYDAVPWWKSFSRIGLELFVDGIRYELPSYLDLSSLLASIGVNMSFTFYMPSFIWDQIFRGRAWTEVSYEGHVIGAINETMAGHMMDIPGYDKASLGKLKNVFAIQRGNPFESMPSQEIKQIAQNTELVKKFLHGLADQGFVHSAAY